MARSAAFWFVSSCAVLCVGLTPTIAQAQIVDAACAGTLDGTFDPGLRLVARNQSISAEGQFGPCLPDTTLNATFSLSGSGELGCLAGSAEVQVIATWSTAEQSVIDVDVDVVLGPGGATLGFTGVVTSGKFAGDAVAFVFTGLTLDPLLCLTSGVEHIDGTFVVTFVPGA